MGRHPVSAYAVRIEDVAAVCLNRDDDNVSAQGLHELSREIQLSGQDAGSSAFT
jgi:hypothetical protein